MSTSRNSRSPQINIAPQLAGPIFSQIVLGLWRLASWDLTVQERVQFLEQALELGIDTLDQADIYGDYRSEILLGEAFAAAPHVQAQFKIITKCGIRFPAALRPENEAHIYDTSARHIIASAENSLRQMRLEKIDLLLIHRPDPLLQADEVASAFEQLQKAGKVLHFGVSNFSPQQFELLNSRFALVSNQVECSLLHPNPIHDGVFDQCQQHRISPLIWSALAGGRLLQASANPALYTHLQALSEQFDCAISSLCIAWLLRHPSHPLVLTGSGKIQSLREAVQATNIQLSRTQWFDCWRAATGAALP